MSFEILEDGSSKPFNRLLHYMYILNLQNKPIWIFNLNLKSSMVTCHLLTMLHQGMCLGGNLSLALIRDAHLDAQSSDIAAERIWKIIPVTNSGTKLLL